MRGNIRARMQRKKIIEMKKFLGIVLVVSLFYSFWGSITFGYESSGEEIWFVEPIRDSYRECLFNWLSYLSGISPMVKDIRLLSTNIADYADVKLVIIPYLWQGGLTAGQITTLKQYVNEGGNLFVGLRPDVITNAWFGTGSLGRYAPKGFVFPQNAILDLSDLFQGQQVPNGIFPSYSGPGYFSQNGLPSTIVPVILDETGRAVAYAGTVGKGKVVFLPNEWQWTIAIGYPTVNSPIMLHLLNYLVSCPIKLQRGMKQYVAIRFDDIFPYIPGIVAVNNVLKSLSITKVTYGIMPSYDATQGLIDELERMDGSEIAMHGDSSGHTPCYNYNYATAYQRFSEAKQKIVRDYGVAPKWYLSPDNGPANPDVEKALYDLSMNWSSVAKDYFGYFLNLRPSGIYDLGIIGEFYFDQVSYWRSIVLFEYCRLLDNVPFTILIHGTENPTYLNSLNSLFTYLKNRNVEFVTFSELISKSHRTLDFSGAFTSQGFDPSIQTYSWTLSEWDATVNLKPSSSGRAFIRFNNTIQSATINGGGWQDFSNDTLVTPVIAAGSECRVTVTFGTPPPPPPSGPMISSTTHPDQNVWYSNNDPVLSWTTQSGSFEIVGYSYALDRSSSSTPDTTIDTLENSMSFNDLSDGEWWFHIRAVNNASVWSATSHFSLRIDTQPPSTSISHAPGDQLARITALDTNSGISSIFVRKNGGSWQVYSGVTTVDILFSGNTSFIIEAYSTDKAGNTDPYVRSLSVNFLTVDTDPPNIDSPTGQGWYDANTTAYVGVSNEAGNVFQYWYLDGRQENPYSTQMSSVPVLMDGPHTITAKFKQISAQCLIYIEHTYRGDLVVDIGVGDQYNPLWSKRVWNGEGGSLDNLNLTLDITQASAYLPPSETNLWFLKVYDKGPGDQGSIVRFTIIYQGKVYESIDPPVRIYDYKTSYACIPKKPQPLTLAHIYIQHTWIGDLVVKLGVGQVNDPLWVITVWNREGGSTDDIDLSIDLSSATPYLPPSSDSTWFLSVYDAARADTGNIKVFSITFKNQTYLSPDPPVPVKDFQTSYAYIPMEPPPPPPEKVYVVIAIDTEADNDHIMSQYHENFYVNMYLPSHTQLSRIFSSEFRSEHVDSYGNPFRMTWFIEADYYIAEGIFYPQETNVSGYTALLQLINKYWSSEIELYGDELAYHHHFMDWVGDRWVRVTQYSDSYHYHMDALNHMILDNEFFPSSFRSGWLWMDEGLSQWLEQWILYDYTTLWAQDEWFPYHPPNMQRWVIRTASMDISQSDIDLAFASAAAGRPSVVSISGHSWQQGGLDSMVDQLHQMLLSASSRYNVTFEYCTARTAIQKCLGYTDVTPPNLSIAQEGNIYTISSDEPIWGNHPYVAVKFSNGTYVHLEATVVRTNTWRLEIPVTGDSSIERVGVAANDLSGNPAVKFRNPA